MHPERDSINMSDGSLRENIEPTGVIGAKWPSHRYRCRCAMVVLVSFLFGLGLFLFSEFQSFQFISHFPRLFWFATRDQA